MKITDIEKSKGDRYTIYVDDEYWFIVDLEVIMSCSIKIGREVDDEFLEQVKIKAERRKARERAYYLLGYRDHSKQELYTKLLKTARGEVALEIVTMVEDQGLIDDSKYAQKLARHYLSTKKWGERRATLEMRRKGIDQAIIVEAIAKCDIDPVEKISELIEKKYSHRLEDYKEKQKVIAALMRQGFGCDDIKQAISQYASTDFEYE